MTHPATDETTPSALKRTFEVEAVITVTVEGGADEARALVDETLRRAHDTDSGRHFVQPWQFELLDEGLVTEVGEDGLYI